jgi:hypothetical protein
MRQNQTLLGNPKADVISVIVFGSAFDPLRTFNIRETVSS